MPTVECWRSDEARRGSPTPSMKGSNMCLKPILPLSAYHGIPVMMCGMVGSRSGWVEAAYVDTPASLDGLAGRAAHVPSTRRRIRILPGLAQRDPARPDVMRGEETQLLALAQAGFQGLVCLGERVDQELIDFPWREVHKRFPRRARHPGPAVMASRFDLRDRAAFIAAGPTRTPASNSCAIELSRTAINNRPRIRSCKYHAEI